MTRLARASAAPLFVPLFYFATSLLGPSASFPYADHIPFNHASTFTSLTPAKSPAMAPDHHLPA